MNWNPLSAIFDSIGKLMGAAKVLKIGQLFMIMLMVVSVSGIFMVGQTMNRHNPNPQTESVRFAKSLEINRQVQSILDAGRGFANADRFIVRQLHNGQKDLSGIPFQFIKTTAASIRPGVSEPASMYNDYPTSAVNELLYEMFTKEKCVLVTVQNARDQGLRRLMIELGVVYTITCPMWNDHHFPVGYMSLGYTDENRKRPENEEIFAMVEKDAVRVATMLTSVTSDENKETMLDKVAKLF